MLYKTTVTVFSEVDPSTMTLSQLVENAVYDREGYQLGIFRVEQTTAALLDKDFPVDVALEILNNG